MHRRARADDDVFELLYDVNDVDDSDSGSASMPGDTTPEWADVHLNDDFGDGFRIADTELSLHVPPNSARQGDQTDETYLTGDLTDYVV